MLHSLGAASSSTSGQGVGECRAVDGSEEERIKQGDLVVVYETYDSMKAVRVECGKIFQNRFGTFPHRDWIGRSFGSKVFSSRRGNYSGPQGYVHLLAPTPELWTRVLPHRTQILYMPDIAVVVSRLNLVPGCIVLESGTGSASLTHSLARAVAPSGHVHTFEFHDLRAKAALDELAQNGLSGLVTVQVRDIQGGGFPADLRGQADAVFLDLPGPWLAVPSAASCLKPDGVLCSFSPCIEQVQRCAEELGKHRFVDLRTMEVLLRRYEFQTTPKQQTGSRSASVTSGEGNCGGSDDGRGLFQFGPWLRPTMEAKGHTGYLLFARQWA